MRRILIVDDDAFIRMLYGEALTSAGYEVVSAVDGQEAYKLFIENIPDLVITDNNMPKMKGVDLILRLRGEGFTIPIILISGDNISARDFLGKALILKKPINVEKLLLFMEMYKET